MVSVMPVLARVLIPPVVMAAMPSIVAVTPAVVAPSVVTVAPSAMRAHIADGVGLSRHWLGGRRRGHHEGRRDDHGRGRESNREFSHRVLLSLRHEVVATSDNGKVETFVPSHDSV